ncbi:MAG TPA: phosphoribosyltransferase family protein [Coriobacteriia bacterium]|nr:phosphoribosyltransferase family protein [Coriobacteriia bacterium]
MFVDRAHAGRTLAEALQGYKGASDAIVLGIPRGGVVVAAEVARELDLPLDVAVAAKVGAPGNPEYAVGAVASDGEVSVNPSAGYSRDEVKQFASDAHVKVERYLKLLREGRPPLELKGKTALLVDDGLATGLTARAAAEWLRRQGVARIIVAVPVASSSAVASLRASADEVIAVSVPAGFYAVGQFYERFGQTEDAEVRELLGEAMSGGNQHAAVRT